MISDRCLNFPFHIEKMLVEIIESENKIEVRRRNQITFDVDFGFAKFEIEIKSISGGFDRVLELDSNNSNN